jgi:hypothetical protein
MQCYLLILELFIGLILLYGLTYLISRFLRIEKYLNK